MDGTRSIGCSHCYLDLKFDKFSNVALGLLIRGLGAGMKVAYIDLNNLALILKDFFDSLNVEVAYFNFKEFNFESLNEYDLVIFDGVSFDVLNEEYILKLIGMQSENLELVFVFDNEENFNIIYDEFDLVSVFNYKKYDLLENSLICVTGNGKGKSTFSFGYILRNLFLRDVDVDLIYFDKGGDFYSERNIFNKIKFNYKVTGISRFDGKKFRFDNFDSDFDEAKRGLDLVKNSNCGIVIADELNTTIGTKLLSEKDVFEVLENRNCEFMITGRYCSDLILDICDVIVDVEEFKHYVKKGLGVRNGVDF